VRRWLKGSDAINSHFKEGPARYGINSFGIEGSGAKKMRVMAI